MKQSWERYRAICYGAAALGIAVCIGCFLVVSDTKNALGVVGDWVWERTGFGLALMPAAVVTILFLAALRFALLADRKQIRCIAAAAVILCAGFCSDLVILHYGGRAGLAESAMAPLSTFSTGYLDPVLTAGSPADYTTHFQQKILQVPDKEIPRHIHVHPPANVLISALALYLPGIGNGIFPETAAELEMLRRETILLPPGNTPEAIAASLNLILGMVLALLAGKGMLMAALLSCRPKTPGLALMLIAFGSGAAVLFLGHYDTFYFCITAAAVLLAVKTLQRDSMAMAVGCGAVLGIGASFSLGYGAVIAAAGGAFLASGGKRFSRLAGLAMGGLLIYGVMALCGMELLGIALKCWDNHRIFNAMAHRSYSLWLPYNLADGLFFAGGLTAILPFAAWLMPRKHPWFP
ncbi:MAG: hypothetical protein J6R85_02255, partial [Lentisphaeria bacterium]|nr:hypothetical protein [Lentisphaeria bacterium]